MKSTNDDELMLLWRQGTSGEPDPAEVARLAARASVHRFDRKLFWRNFREYVAGVFFVGCAAWLILSGTARELGMLPFAYGGTAAVGFVMCYLWWQHRGVPSPDPSADARAYHAAMLARVDKQIRLLGSVRYWYLLPLYIPGLWVFWQTWKKSPSGAVMTFAIYTGVYIFVGWLNERLGVARLREKRSKIEALYEEVA